MHLYNLWFKAQAGSSFFVFLDKKKTLLKIIQGYLSSASSALAPFSADLFACTCLCGPAEHSTGHFLALQLSAHAHLKCAHFSFASFSSSCHDISRLLSVYFNSLFTHLPKVFILAPALLLDAITMHLSTALANLFWAALTFGDMAFLPLDALRFLAMSILPLSF